MMKKLSLYIDSSVWNMCYNDHVPALQRITKQFMLLAQQNIYTIAISDFVEAELRRAPEARRKKLIQSLQQVSPERLPVTQEVNDLQQAYLRNGIFKEYQFFDAGHVAVATVYDFFAIISWNYKHLANINREEKVHAINLLQGYYRTPRLITPLEVMSND